MAQIDLRRGAAGPRPFPAWRRRQAAAPLTIRLFLGFGSAVFALTLLASAGWAASESAGDGNAKPEMETEAVLARAACQDAVRDAYWQAVSACLALAEPADRGQCGAAARVIRQHDMAVCMDLSEETPKPRP